MNKKVFRYLRNYSFDPEKIDRLIVSAFLSSKHIRKVKNVSLKKFIIKKTDEDYSNLQEFLEIQTFSKLEQLIEIFEFVISPKEKIVTGAIYTPSIIREYIVKQTFAQSKNIESVTICDPACGSAGFLYTAARIIKKKTKRSYREIFKNNIFGLDIQNYSITRSRLFLTLLAVCDNEDERTFDFNLFRDNALNFQWSDHISNFSGFDIIVSNPPYVCSRNIDKESKQLLSNWNVCSTGHPDLYIPFFEIGLANLKPQGVLGFITMNTFFKSINGRALREYFNDKKFNFKIIDFGGQQVFQSKSTYTCICLIQKSEVESIQYTKLTSLNLLTGKISYNSIPYSKLDSFNGWNLQQHDILSKIESTGIPLGKRFLSRNGIATLKNKIYIFDPVKEDRRFYYLQNGGHYQIEKDICRDIINPNKLTKFNFIEPLKKKIIFPYYYENNQIRLLDNDIFENKYPKAYNYLKTKKEILSTRDKGNGNYEKWYAFGRNQSLEKLKYKLFFPHIARTTPNYVLNSDENLLFYNGLAIIGKNERELLFLKKLMSSRLFWFYITNSSKPYETGYFSLSRNYIKNFGIYDFTEEETDQMINENDSEELDDFIESKYDITI
ncbi:MAG: SAM-dependent DNA methyltransferase [Desulfobacteraceae bacterium]|nr:SAM-dependent DNA methyltransferase [Desulfobacteraceae bacterium]